MKCEHCGFETNEDFNFCAKCGAANNDVIFIEPIENKVLSALKDKMFLAICVLMTVSCAISLFIGNFNIISILITVFLWLTYSKSLKDIADAKFLRCVSGTVYANYIISNVTAIILIVCGIISGLLSGFLVGNMDSVLSFFGEYGVELTELLSSIPQAFFAVTGWLIGVIFIIASVIILVINIAGFRHIHRFAKSIHKSLTENAEIYNPALVKKWFIFFGVCAGISAFLTMSENFFAAVSTGCTAAANFICVVMINKHFK